MISSVRFLLVLIFYAMISAFGLFRMKAAPGIITWDFALGFTFYCLGFLIWLGILRIYPLSIAFPTAAGLLIVATQFIGIVLLREQLSWTGAVGVVLITCGIVLLSVTRTTGGPG